MNRPNGLQRLLLVLSALLAISLFAAGCGGGDDDTDVDSAEPAAAEEAAEEPEPEPEPEEPEPEPDEDAQAVDTTLEDEELEELGSEDADSGQVDSGPVHGGTLVIGMTQTPRHLNGVVQSGLATAVPGTQLNASPLMFDENFEPQPYLAESWELAEDGLSLTLNLVEGALFHDGEPVTSADVAFSVMTAQAHHPFKPMFAPVTEVETPDAQTAIIHLSQPHPAILLAMSPGLLPVIPKHIFDDGQEMPTHPRNTEDFIGSGPFKLAEYKAGELIRLEKFDDFFIPERPYLDEIVIQITPDAASVVLGLETGSVDVSATLGGAANILALQENDDVIITAEGHEAIGPVEWLEFNVEDPALADVRVRQAIAYAVDRTFLTDVVRQETSFAATTGIVPASPFHNPNTEQYDWNVDKAKELLAEAGVVEGELSVLVDYIPPAQLPIAEYIVAALQEIGINAELNTSADFPSWAQRVAAGEHQMTVNNVWNWGDPVIGVHRTYLSENRVGAIWTNNTGYSNPEVDTLFEKAGQAVDRAERVDLYAQAQEIIAQDVPIHFLMNPPFWQAYRPTVQNPSVGIWGLMSPMHEVWLAE